jgi:hypothetical protein
MLGPYQQIHGDYGRQSFLAAMARRQDRIADRTYSIASSMSIRVQDSNIT